MVPRDYPGEGSRRLSSHTFLSSFLLSDVSLRKSHTLLGKVHTKAPPAEIVSSWEFGHQVGVFLLLLFMNYIILYAYYLCLHD